MDRLRTYLYKFVGTRVRSKKEILDWLRKKKINKELTDEIIQELDNLKLINDEEYAKQWVNYRLEFSPKAKRVINHELRFKGINEEIINQVLEEINDEEIAKRLVKKYKSRWENLDKITRKKKMIQFLGYRGFDWETIKGVIYLDS